MQLRDKIKSIYENMSGEQRLRTLLNCLANDSDITEVSDIVSSLDMDWENEKVINKKNFKTLIARNNFLYSALLGVMTDSLFFQIQLCITLIENYSLKFESKEPIEQKKEDIIEAFEETIKLVRTIEYLKRAILKIKGTEWSFLPDGFIENWLKKI